MRTLGVIWRLLWSALVLLAWLLLYLTDCAVGLVRWVWERVNRR